MGGTKLRKLGIAIGLVAILILFLVSANALPRLFPNLNLFGKNTGESGLDGFRIGDFSFDFELPKMPPIIGFLAQRSSNSIIVTTAPLGLDWKDVDIANSKCSLPTGDLTAGDMITNCEGTIILNWRPTNSLLGTWEFSSLTKPYTPPVSTSPTDNNQPSETDEPSEEDTTQPELPDIEDIIDDILDPIIPDETDTTTPQIATLEITKPQSKSLYFRNDKKIMISKIIVIGDIDIKTDFEYSNETDISGVKFYIDEELMHFDTTEPYEWTWDEKAIGRFTITTVLISKTLGEIAYDETDIFIINLSILN